MIENCPYCSPTTAGEHQPDCPMNSNNYKSYSNTTSAFTLNLWYNTFEHFQYCPDCGRKTKYDEYFCPMCGRYLWMSKQYPYIEPYPSNPWWPNTITWPYNTYFGMDFAKRDEP